MREEWWEGPTRILNDYWWILLILLILGLAGWFAWDYWIPDPPLVTLPVITQILIPSPISTSTLKPLPTITLEPTATRVEALGTGDVQVTLTWDSINDLDLWVTDPAGETIYFEHKNSVSKGELDVDANPGCASITTSPVENIYWPTGEAPDGIYTVAVQYFEICQPENRTPFTLTLKVNGKMQIFNGVALEQGELIEITTFEMQR